LKKLLKQYFKLPYNKALVWYARFATRPTA
jgi:hypothetical protein